MDYQYKSICRGEHSIMGQIKKAGVDPSGKSTSRSEQVDESDTLTD